MPKLTDKLIATLRCPAGKKDALVFDTEQRKLGLRVTASGSKVFLVQWNGRDRQAPPPDRGVGRHQMSPYYDR